VGGGVLDVGGGGAWGGVGCFVWLFFFFFFGGWGWGRESLLLLFFNVLKGASIYSQTMCIIVRLAKNRIEDFAGPYTLKSS